MRFFGIAPVVAADLVATAIASGLGLGTKGVSLTTGSDETLRVLVESSLLRPRTDGGEPRFSETARPR